MCEEDKQKSQYTPNIDFNNHFKLPIYYNNKKINLKPHIINDLELSKNIDPSCNSMYSFLFNNKDEPFSDKIIEQVSEYYTTDIDFLKDNQQLIKTYEPNKPNKPNNISKNSIIPF
jgi:hypothetical protein